MEVARLAQHGTVFELDLVRDGRAVIERRVDTGVETRLEHPTERAAILAYHAALAGRFETGWRRIGPLPEPAGPMEEPNLVAAALRGDEGALSVYTDWLLDRGDPRGEYAALRTDPGPNVTRLAQLQHEHDLEVLGPLCAFPTAWRDELGFTSQRGWIDEISCRQLVFAAPGYSDHRKEVLHLALHAPMARFARALAVDEGYAEGVVALRDCPRIAGMRSLRLLSEVRDDAPLLAALPALETIELRGALDAGHPRAHTLRARVQPYTDRFAGHWPALRRVELHLAGRNEREALLRGFFLSDMFSQITSLELATDNGVNATLVRALIASPFFSRLERLELRSPVHEKARALVETARNAHTLEVVYL